MSLKCQLSKSVFKIIYENYNPSLQTVYDKMSFNFLSCRNKEKTSY